VAPPLNRPAAILTRATPSPGAVRLSHQSGRIAMNMHEIQAKTLLSSTARPDSWFGIKYTMNLYRGCQHHCIYCDSRSECYQIEDFDGEVLIKANAPELLRKELAHKRIKGYIGTGSMNDPYMPLERQVGLTRRALEIIAEFGFPVHILTKSDLVLRDIDVLEQINERASTAVSPGVVVSFTITTANDDLARRIEPGAPPSSARFRALETFAARGFRTGVMLMPVLPFIEDTVENITGVVTRAHECGAAHVVPGFGMTLRDRQREYYYRQLDRLFPGLRDRYEAAFDNRYSAPAQQPARLELTFNTLMQRLDLQRGVPPYEALAARQLPLF
jgi:DNA repair photolyase